MRVLVVGGAGYIGSHAAWMLQRSGHEIWVYDNLSEGHEAAAPAGKLIVGDLKEQEKLQQVFAEKKIDAVMHFAASCYVGVSVTDPSAVLSKQHRGDAVAARRDARQRRRRRSFFPAPAPRTAFPTSCRSPKRRSKRRSIPYGFTKLAIEHALADYSHAYGLQYAALRYFNASGASDEQSDWRRSRP